MDFLPAQNYRQLFVFRGTGQDQGRPPPLNGVLKEKLESAEVNGRGGRADGFTQREKIAA
jgi:hypothetical protein